MLQNYGTTSSTQWGSAPSTVSEDGPFIAVLPVHFPSPFAIFCPCFFCCGTGTGTSIIIETISRCQSLGWWLKERALRNTAPWLLFLMCANRSAYVYRLNVPDNSPQVCGASTIFRGKCTIMYRCRKVVQNQSRQGVKVVQNTGWLCFSGEILRTFGPFDPVADLKLSQQKSLNFVTDMQSKLEASECKESECLRKNRM